MKTDPFHSWCWSFTAVAFFVATIAGCNGELSVSEDAEKKAELILPPGAPAPSVVVDEPTLQILHS